MAYWLTSVPLEISKDCVSSDLRIVVFRVALYCTKTTSLLGFSPWGLAHNTNEQWSIFQINFSLCCYRAIWYFPPGGILIHLSSWPSSGFTDIGHFPPYCTTRQLSMWPILPSGSTANCLYYAVGFCIKTSIFTKPDDNTGVYILHNYIMITTRWQSGIPIYYFIHLDKHDKPHLKGRLLYWTV